MPLSGHASRWLVAAILAPLLLAAIFLAPRPVFEVVVAAAGLVALREFYALSFGPERKGLLVVGAVGLVLILFAPGLEVPGAGGAALVLALCLGFLYFLLNLKDISAIINQVGLFALGHVYLSLFLSFLLRLYRLPEGPRWVFFLILVTFLADTAAFYLGRTLGRRPLYAAVSPNKTWEGLLGGLAGGALTAVLAGLGGFPSLALSEAAALGAALGLWGAVGDLFESMLKRSRGVKDTGRIMLGHGGMLDRLDALLFNAPLVYFYVLVRFPAGS